MHSLLHFQEVVQFTVQGSFFSSLLHFQAFMEPVKHIYILKLSLSPTHFTSYSMEKIKKKNQV
jgi:hypothetical protein